MSMKITHNADGPNTVPPQIFCTWTARVTGGQSPFHYQWFRNGVPVGTNSNDYTADTGTSDFSLSVEVTDAFDRTDTDGLFVTVSSSADGENCGTE